MSPSKQLKSLTTFCGLYCGDCYAYTKRLARLAGALRKLLREYNIAAVSKVVPFDGLQHYRECDAFLEALTFLRCEKTCRGGGGNPFCPIRACCQQKGFAGCWQCGEWKDCATLQILEPVHGDANKKNLRTIKKHGIEKWHLQKRWW